MEENINTVTATMAEISDSKDAGVSAATHDDLQHSEAEKENLQRGVQDVEGVTMTWSKLSLSAVFVKYVIPRPANLGIQDIMGTS